MQASKWNLRPALRVMAVVVAASLLFATFRDVDFAQVSSLLAKIPKTALALILLPQLLALSAECIGWRWVFATRGRHVDFMQLLAVRASTEALAQTLPMGVVWAESIKPMLLGRRCGVPVTESIAAIAARKYLLMSSQAVYVAGLALLGFSALHAISTRVIGMPGLEWIVLGAGAVALTGAVGMRLMFAEGALVGRLFSLLRVVPIARLQKVLAGKGRGFDETDRELSRYFRLGALRAHAPAIWFLMGWLCEALETYLILRLLGVDLDFTTVGAFEVALSFVRNVVFILPAGIGVQDLGYVAFLKALGVDDALAVGAAFVLLKRAKEAFWAAVGYGALLRVPQCAALPEAP